MQRSGQCKCGTILKFEEGPAGFKGRCPKCGAVVRLRVEEGSEPPPAKRRRSGRPPRPSDPGLSVVALRTPGPVAPGEPDPDATTPFEPIEEIELEPWPVAPRVARPSFLRQYHLVLLAGGVALLAVGVLLTVGLWFWLG
jgi:hypothetical protein